MNEADFARVVEEGRALQRRLPDLRLVAVGGTAAALHCHHRYSLDVDAVTPYLESRYSEIADALDHWEGWTTNRRNPPVLILGERHGVELGVRQQRREVPLQTQEVNGLLIPTLAEMLRVKAFLLVQRRATRDYVDFAALAGQLGERPAVEALTWLNAVYPASGALTLVSRLAEACEAEPADAAAVDLTAYKGLRPPLTDLGHVIEQCRSPTRRLVRLELTGALPAALNQRFYESPPS